MPDVSATEAARRFADLLDDVEHRGQGYTVVRRGRPVARITPVRSQRGAAVKNLLRAKRPDRDWAAELDEVRSLLEFEVRE